MDIRPIEQKDIEQSVAIYKRWVNEKTPVGNRGGDRYFREKIETALNQAQEAVAEDLHYLVAVEGDEILGILGYRKPPANLKEFATTENPLELYVLFAKESKKGAGKALVDAMFEAIKDSNYTEVIVFSADRWKDSWLFYDKLGFERIGQMPEWTGKMSQIWHKLL